MINNVRLETEVGVLVKLLFSENSLEKTEARQRLVKIGRPVIPFLNVESKIAASLRSSR